MMPERSASTAAAPAARVGATPRAAPVAASSSCRLPSVARSHSVGPASPAQRGSVSGPVSARRRPATVAGSTRSAPRAPTAHTCSPVRGHVVGQEARAGRRAQRVPGRGVRARIDPQQRRAVAVRQPQRAAAGADAERLARTDPHPRAQRARAGVDAEHDAGDVVGQPHGAERAGERPRVPREPQPLDHAQRRGGLGLGGGPQGEQRDRDGRDDDQPRGERRRPAARPAPALPLGGGAQLDGEPVDEAVAHSITRTRTASAASALAASARIRATSASLSSSAGMPSRRRARRRGRPLRSASARSASARPEQPVGGGAGRPAAALAQGDGERLRRQLGGQRGIAAAARQGAEHRLGVAPVERLEGRRVGAGQELFVGRAGHRRQYAVVLARCRGCAL